MADSDVTSSDLADWMDRKRGSYAQNRQTTIEPRWTAAYEAFRRRFDMDTAKKFLPGQSQQPWHCESYPGWLKSKVVAGAAVVKDMLSRGGRIAFMLEPENVATEMDPGKSRTSAFGHETYIHRQCQQTHALDRLCLLVDDAALYGVCWSEETIETVDTDRFVQLAEGIVDFVDETEEVPAIDRVSPWEMLWDLEAPRAPHREGECVMRVRPRSKADVAAYLGKKWFLGPAIAEAVQSAPSSSSGTTTPVSAASRKPSEIEIQRREKTCTEVIFWGQAPRNLVEDFERKNRLGADAEGGEPAAPERTGDSPEARMLSEHESVECHAVMVNKIIVRFVRTTKRERLYRCTFWEDHPDIPGGVGIADNAMDAQNNMVGLLRMLINNIKQAGKVAWAGKKEYLVDDPGSIEVGQFIQVRGDCPSVKDAFQQLVTQDVSAGVERAMEWVMRLGDLETMIPKTEQGEDSDYVQTATEITQRLERAGRYFSGVLGRFDELVASFIEYVYRYNLRSPDCPPELKGNFRVKALGFASFYNRVSRLNHLFTLLNIILSNPSLTQLARLRWIVEEICKAIDMDPAQVLKTAQEMENEAAELEAQQAQLAAAGQPQDPAQQALVLANIERLKAESARLRADAVAIADKSRVTKALAVQKLATPPAPPAVAKARPSAPPARPAPAAPAAVPAVAMA